MLGNSTKPLTHGSLFSGIGGFDLAAEWMGWENKFHCEINPFGRKILNYYWPNSICYEDICATDFTIWRGKIDVLSGGFPCQPFSTAGKRAGSEDSRYLWPEMLRVIREVRPKWIVGENVLGLVNWNEGLVFDTVCNDLENEGFKVIPIVLGAASVNAPHKRQRIFFVAKNTLCDGFVQPQPEKDGSEVWTQRNVSTGSGNGIHLQEGLIADTDNPGDTSSGFGDNGIRKEEEQDRNISLNELSGFGNQGFASDPSSIGCRGGSFKTGTDQSEEWSLDSNFGHDRNGVRSETSGCSTTTSDPERFRLEQCKDSGEVDGGQGEIQGSRSESSYESSANVLSENPSYTDSKMLEHRDGKGETGGRTIEKERIKSFDSTGSWETFPTQSPICFRNDGISSRLDGITFPKWRNESIKGAGNAVVPHVIKNIFQAIQDDTFR